MNPYRKDQCLYLKVRASLGAYLSGLIKGLLPVLLYSGCHPAKPLGVTGALQSTGDIIGLPDQPASLLSFQAALTRLPLLAAFGSYGQGIMELHDKKENIRSTTGRYDSFNRFLL